MEKVFYNLRASSSHMETDWTHILGWTEQKLFYTVIPENFSEKKIIILKKKADNKSMKNYLAYKELKEALVPNVMWENTYHFFIVLCTSHLQPRPPRVGE